MPSHKYIINFRPSLRPSVCPTFLSGIEYIAMELYTIKKKTSRLPPWRAMRLGNFFRRWLVKFHFFIKVGSTLWRSRIQVKILKDAWIPICIYMPDITQGSWVLVWNRVDITKWVTNQKKLDAWIQLRSRLKVNILQDAWIPICIYMPDITKGSWVLVWNRVDKNEVSY